MSETHNLTKSKLFIKAARPQRLISAWICVSFGAICVVLVLAAFDKIPLSSLFLPCGFKMRTGLPCPTCGFTTATLAFFKGHIFEAFYIQPAGAILCVLVVLAVFLSFICAVFGVYFAFLKSLRLKFIVITAILVIAGGWAVTLARALS